MACTSCKPSNSKAVEQMTIAELRAAADKHDPKVQFELGLRFHNGDGVLKEPIEAAEWWRKAAEQKLPEAEYNLGVAYWHGDGVPKDKQEGMRLCRLAANSGLPAAQESLGKIYCEGGGVTATDYTEAFNWFKKAAGQNYPPAQYYLAICFRDGKGIMANQTEAVLWLQRAASNGVANAQVELGKHYSAAGFAQLIQKSNTLNQIQIDAVRDAGEIASEMIATNQNLMQAANWFHKAANQNYPYGHAFLGGAFMLGAGVGKDPAEAYKWFSLTMTNEHDLGKMTIELMKARGMTFTPAQISAGKLRAEEFSKTNHISPKTVIEIPGL